MEGATLLLAGLLGAGIQLLTRRVWAGTLVGAGAGMFLFWRGFGFMAGTFLIVGLFALVGSAGGLLALCIRSRRVRSAILTGTGMLLTMGLFHLFMLMHTVHNPEDVVFAVTLVGTTLIFGSVAALGCRPDAA